MNYHYIDTQNREIGPVPISALHALRAAGSLTDVTLTRSEVGGPWAPLGALLGPAPGPTATVGAASPAIKAASVALADARAALKHVLTNPALGLPDAWNELGPRRALAAGLAMLSSTFLLVLVLIQLSDSFLLILFRPNDALGWLKLIFAIVGSVAVFISVMFGARRATGSSTGYECDIFVVGNASLLGAVLWAAFVLLGFKNIEMLVFFAMGIYCLVVVQLFIGLTRIGGVREREASLILPLVVLAGGWAAKFFFSAVY